MKFNSVFKENRDSSLDNFFLSLKKIFDNNKKILIILRGAPGSSKTTLGKKIIKLYPKGQIFETDDLFYVDGDYKFDFTKLKEYHQKNQERVRAAMKEEVSPIIVSNTSIKKWEMGAYIQMAKENGYYIIIRKLTGQFKNEHGVPEDKVKMMRDNFEDLTPDDIKELNAHIKEH